MTVSSYHVTASTGGWRSVPWPFGLFDVTDGGLRIHSWHCTWWVEDWTVTRESIESIHVSRRLGAVTLTITDHDSGVAKVKPASSPRRVIQDLLRRGYHLT